MSERMKFLRYQNKDFTSYFWRTSQQQEIDLIEDSGTDLSAYEFKWNTKANVRFPQTFTENYEVAETLTVTPDNIEKFLLD
jgi:hypothetical protein